MRTSDADGRVAGLTLRRRRRARRRPRRVRRRHPPARPARPRRRPGRRRARRRRRRRRAARPRRPASARSARSPATRGRVYGLVAPGYAMAEVVADRLAGGADARSPAPTCRRRSSCSACEVASVGDPHAAGRRDRASPTRRRAPWQKVVVDADGRVLGRRARRRHGAVRRRSCSALRGARAAARRARAAAARRRRGRRDGPPTCPTTPACARATTSSLRRDPRRGAGGLRGRRPA